MELGIVIGRRTSYLNSVDEARDAIAGYVVVNDVSERAFQMERGGQWVKGKSAETFNPAGPWLVTPEEIDDVLALDLWLDVNGVRRQTGSTATMVFDPYVIVHYPSQFLVLEPGDLIDTGTPPGCGHGLRPAGVAAARRRHGTRHHRPWVAASARSRAAVRLNRPLALLVAGTLFMEILDGTIIATAAPAIAADLSVQPVDINLAMTAYLVTIAAGIPISGWLTDRFGGRRIFTTAVVVFTVASVLCAASVTFPMLVASRILQGLGGALMVPVGRLVVLRMTAKRDLLDVVAYLTWPALLAPVIAPALGGWILTVASWHWIFVINVPLGLVALVAAARLVPADRPSAVVPLDWVGFVLSAAVLIGLLSSLELIAPGGGLSAVFVIGLCATGALAVLAAIWFRRTRHPLLKFAALHQRSFRVGNVERRGVPLGDQRRAVPPAADVSGRLRLESLAGRGFGAHALRGQRRHQAGHEPADPPWGFRAVLIGSVVGGAVVFGLIALLRPETPLVVIIAVLVLSGIFRSIGFSVYNSLQFADIDADVMTDANTLASTLQQVALGLGIAVGAVVLRVGEAALGDAGGAGPYRIAFFVLSLLMLYPLVDALLLPRDSGDEVAGRIA